jgi:hypothetical protein
MRFQWLERPQNEGMEGRGVLGRRAHGRRADGQLERPTRPALARPSTPAALGTRPALAAWRIILTVIDTGWGWLGGNSRPGVDGLQWAGDKLDWGGPRGPRRMGYLGGTFAVFPLRWAPSILHPQKHAPDR